MVRRSSRLSISDRARLGYSLTRDEGPNDGLTQIIDEIPSGSITIPELGLRCASGVGPRQRIDMEKQSAKYEGY